MEIPRRDFGWDQIDPEEEPGFKMMLKKKNNKLVTDWFIPEVAVIIFIEKLRRSMRLRTHARNFKSSRFAR